jgi:hypothetical protein
MAQSIEDIMELDKQISQFKRVEERLFRFSEGSVDIPKDVNLKGLNIYDMFRKKFRDYVSRHLKPKLIEQLRKNSESISKKYTFFKAVLSNLKRLRKTVLEFCGEIELLLRFNGEVTPESLSFTHSVRLKGKYNKNWVSPRPSPKISKKWFLRNCPRQSTWRDSWQVSLKPIS